MRHDAYEILIRREIPGVCEPGRGGWWNPYLRATGTPAEASRRDSDHNQRLAVHGDGPAEQRGIAAEAAPPQIVAHDGNAAAQFVAGRENSATFRAHLQRRPVAGRHHLCLHGRRNVAREGDHSSAERAYMIE